MLWRDTTPGSKKRKANNACDYAFHMAVTRYRRPDGSATQGDRPGRDNILQDFSSYKNFFGVDDEEMFQTLKLAAKLGVITTAHCENAELVGQLQQQLLGRGQDRGGVA